MLGARAGGAAVAGRRVRGIVCRASRAERPLPDPEAARPVVVRRAVPVGWGIPDAVAENLVMWRLRPHLTGVIASQLGNRHLTRGVGGVGRASGGW